MQPVNTNISGSALSLIYSFLYKRNHACYSNVHSNNFVNLLFHIPKFFDIPLLSCTALSLSAKLSISGSVTGVIRCSLLHATAFNSTESLPYCRASCFAIGWLG